MRSSFTLSASRPVADGNRGALSAEQANTQPEFESRDAIRRRVTAVGRADGAGYFLWWRATAVPPAGIACFSALNQMLAMTA